MIRLGKVIVVASEIKKISCIWRQHNKLLQNMWVKTAVYCMDHYYISHSGSSDDLIQRWTDLRWYVCESHSVMSDSAIPWTSPCLWSHGILQARILERVAFPSRGSSQPRDQTQVSCTAVILYELSQQGKPKNTGVGSLFLLQWIFTTQESNWGLLHCKKILYQLSYQGSWYVYVCY